MERKTYSTPELLRIDLREEEILTEETTSSFGRDSYETEILTVQ